MNYQKDGLKKIGGNKMKTISIIAKSNREDGFLIGHISDIRVINDTTGEDISKYLRSVVVRITPGEIVTAKLEVNVSELDLPGTKIKADE